MINYYKFLKQMIKSPKSIGAITPSSPYLAKKMLNDINFQDNITIIEYGAGTGAFTKKIIKNMNKNSHLYIIENNPNFYKMLVEKFSSYENVTIFFESAENISNIVNRSNIEKIDYILSGIPFTSLPKNVRNNIFKSTKSVMNPHTKL